MIRSGLLLSLCIAACLLCSCHANRNSKAHAHREGTSGKQHYYESKLGVNLDDRSNLKLYEAVDKWIGVPHQMGSCTAKGIDCSCLVNTLCREVYQCNTPRDTKGLYAHCERIRKEDLREGDILFFQMKGGKVDHVGMYLTGGKFVHASVKRGVMISSMEEPHFEKAFKHAGRTKCSS